MLNSLRKAESLPQFMRIGSQPFVLRNTKVYKNPSFIIYFVFDYSLKVLFLNLFIKSIGNFKINAAVRHINNPHNVTNTGFSGKNKIF